MDNTSSNHVNGVNGGGGVNGSNSLKSDNTKQVVNGNNDQGGNVCMALRHKKYPHYGVQFHPESIGTGVAGFRMLENFCHFAAEYRDYW